MDLSEIHVHANGIDFAALTAGDGPLVLLLHGFPDNAHTWDHQLGALAQAGYRAVAPFIRGYHPTGVPADGLDRKSTRLNSSHANNSYAVFCLKKKTRI